MRYGAPGIVFMRRGYEVGGRVDVVEGGAFEAASFDFVLTEQIGDGAVDLDQEIDAAGGERAWILAEVGEGTLAEAIEHAGGAPVLMHRLLAAL